MAEIYPSVDYEPVRPGLRAAGGEAARAEDGPAPRVAEAREPARRSEPNNRALRRGHAVSFAGLLAFTAVLVFRPYEMFSALAGLTELAQWLAFATLLVFFPMQLALEGNLTARILEVRLVLLLAAVALVSVVFANNPALAWETYTDNFGKAVLIFIVIVNVVRTERRLRLLIYVALAVTFVLSAGALTDYSAGRVPVEGYRIKGWIGGMFGNPNDLALHLVTMTPLCLAFMLRSRNWLVKGLFLALALLAVAAIVVTFSRGGFLGLIGCVLFLFWKLGRDRRLLVAVVGGVALALFLAFSPGQYGVRILSIFVPGLDPVGSASHRQSILFRSIHVSLRHPLLGIGMGNFNAVSHGETVSHNAYTEVSAETGMIALAFYLMFIVNPLRKLKQVENETAAARRGRDRGFYYLSIGLQASLVGYMISSFFASVAFNWYVYYLVGYAVCLRRIYEARREAGAGETLARGEV
jgi:putative inorganic carbon (HCO3(-)) transporter